MAPKNGQTQTSDEDLLVLPLDFEMERSGTIMRRFLISLSLLVAMAIGVLAVAPIREVAIAQGEIRSSGDLIEVQHPEGGEVAAVLAHRGAVVRPGDPILRLRPIGAETDFERLAVRRAALLLAKERLDALLGERAPEFPPSPRLTHEVVTNERTLFELEQSALDRRVAALEARLRQRRAEAGSKAIEITEIKAEIAAYREQLGMREQLAQKGYATRNDFLTLQAQYSEARSREALAQGQLSSTEEAIAQTEAEIAEALASQRSEWSRELSQTETELAELDRQIVRQADRVERMTVRAPAFGVLHELHVATAGAVVQPGGQVATVVPLEGDVIAEVRITPGDIGHIETGDAAIVRISTFDPETVGEIYGVVRQVSPTAFSDEQGQRFYKASLTLDRTEVALGEERHALAPGMAVDAQIRTGEKSVLRYLFKPVARALDRAFSER